MPSWEPKKNMAKTRKTESKSEAKKDARWRLNPDDLYARLRLFRGDLYRELPSRRAQCIVCYDAFTDLNNTGLQTCGDPMCRAVLDLFPEWIHPDKIRRESGKNRKGCAAKRSATKRMSTFDKFSLLRKHSRFIDSRFVEYDFDTAAWFVDNDWIGADIRGSNVRDTIKASPWNPRSKLLILHKAIGGRPALRLTVPTNAKPITAVREAFDLGEFGDAVDYCMVWKCGCPLAHEIRWKSLDEVPTGFGYHDACGGCGCAPLEIAREKDEQFRI